MLFLRHPVPKRGEKEWEESGNNRMQSPRKIYIRQERSLTLTHPPGDRTEAFLFVSHSTQKEQDSIPRSTFLLTVDLTAANSHLTASSPDTAISILITPTFQVLLKALTSLSVLKAEELFVPR